MRNRAICVTASALLCVGCQASSDPGSGGVSAAAFEAELMAADRAFNDSTQARGSAGWVSFFDPDGAMIQPNQGEIRGVDAIAEAIRALDDPSFTLTWEPLRAQGSDDGTLGYTVGRYESTVLVEADTTVSRGLYVSVWRRQSDGGLRVVMDLGNPVQD
jgi:ketosteroid isomerase-like protein